MYSSKTFITVDKTSTVILELPDGEQDGLLYMEVEAADPQVGPQRGTDSAAEKTLGKVPKPVHVIVLGLRVEAPNLTAIPPR